MNAELHPIHEEECSPLWCYDFNYLGHWFNGAFVGADNASRGEVDSIIDYESGKYICSNGECSDLVSPEIREALVQALLMEKDKTSGVERISN